MRVEFLYWEECPSHPEALALLREVMEERGITDPIDMREVLTHEAAVELTLPRFADDPRRRAGCRSRRSRLAAKS